MFFTTETASIVSAGSPGPLDSSAASASRRTARGLALLRARTLALVVCGGLLAGAASAQKGPEIQLTNGILPITQLLIGDDLFAGLTHGEPGRTYDFRLTSGGQVVHGAYAAADEAGTVPQTRIWSRSGVVGCDCELGANPESFRYLNYSDAEIALNGKVLLLQVLTMDGVEVARVEIPALRGAREIAYFSDAAGCPRTTFQPGEPIYMSFLHPDRSRLYRRIFLAETKAWPLGASIFDVRGGSQWSPLPAGTSDLVTILVTASLIRSGAYDGIIRLLSTIDPIRYGDDHVVGTHGGPRGGSCPESGGIVITVDGCPNCGGQSYP